MIMPKIKIVESNQEAIELTLVKSWLAVSVLVSSITAKAFIGRVAQDKVKDNKVFLTKFFKEIFNFKCWIFMLISTML